MALVNFLQAFFERLDTLADRVYYGDSTDPRGKIPYVVYRYTSTIDIEKLEDFIMEVDIIDNGPDPLTIEGIVNAIDGDGNITSPSGMNYYNLKNVFRCFRINRLNLPSGDENLLRRQLRYRCRVKV